MKPVLVVTGGSRGIGAATARLAALAGYSVCLSYNSQSQAAESVVDGIVASGGDALAVQADLAVENDVVRLFAMASTLGPLRGGEPDEVARAIVWLLSDAASYCTGSLLDVSGGR